MRRFQMAAASYALWVMLSVLLFYAGFLRVAPATVPWLIGGIFACNLVFYFLIRSSLNLRLSDPSMTQAQLLVAMLWVLSLMFMAGESRGVMITVYLISMLFGVFRLNIRQFTQLAIFGLVGYIGVVVLENRLFPGRTDFMREVINLLVLAAALVWVVIFGSYIGGLRQKLRERNTELRGAVREFSQMALHDPLTDSFNRRYIMQSLHDEKVRADRTRSGFAVAILDLDHFKKINDRFGHLTGDNVLKSFARLIREQLAIMLERGDGDGLESFARFGGEEFILVMPHTTLEDARRRCELLRQATFDASFDDVFRITVSIGIAEYRPVERFEEALRRADHAMYRAKDSGRNRVEIYDEDKDAHEESPTRHRIQNVLTGRFRKIDQSFGET